jgi:bacteriocin biosynthesis cyclodehydratase domain-containing protein
MAPEAAAARLEVLRTQLEDHNLRFPRHPRLTEDVRIFEMPDGLGFQFRGLEVPVIVRGRRAQACLDWMLPIMDGARTVADIVALRPSELDEELILRTLLLLHGKGLIAPEARFVPPAPEGWGTETLRRQELFWGRHLDIARNAGSGAEIQSRIGQTRVGVLAMGLIGAVTADVLARTGFAGLWVLGWGDGGFAASSVQESAWPARETARVDDRSTTAAIDVLEHWAEDIELLVSATFEAPRALQRAINEWAVAAGIPWLRANVDGGRIDVGPLVHPEVAGCYRCMEMREASIGEFAIEDELYHRALANERLAPSAPKGESLPAATVAAGMLAAEAVRVVTGVSPPTLTGSVLSVSSLSSRVDFHRFLPVPRCLVCHRSG